MPAEYPCNTLGVDFSTDHSLQAQRKNVLGWPGPVQRGVIGRSGIVELCRAVDFNPIVRTMNCY